MEYVFAIAWIMGAALGTIVLYLVIKEAVKQGILAADKERKKGE